MRVALMGVVFAAGALLSAGHAAAQDSEFPVQPEESSQCGQFAAYWAQVADIARQRGCTPPGEEWTSDFNEQMKVCNGSYDTVSFNIAKRNAVMSQVTAGNCGACAVIVDQQQRYAIGNELYQCKFSAGGNWDTNRAESMAVCLGAFNLAVTQDKVGGSGNLAFIRNNYKTRLADMRAQIEECKRTHQPQGCMFAGCHSSNSSHSSLAVPTMPKSGNALREPLRQRQDRTRPKVVKVVDPCKASARSFDPSCSKKPATSATNSGAMDRLQGGSPPGPSPGTREQRETPSKPAATAAPSAPAAPSPLFNRPPR